MTKSRAVALSIFLCASLFAKGQELKTKNLVLITLDGMRWQEVFGGADSSLVFNEKFTKDQNAVSFFSGDEEVSRSKLLTFFWNTIAQQGQLYGNRRHENLVNCANPHWFSYPGYSEILTGFIDRRIKSNRAIENPNETVLEFLNRQPGFENKVAAFTTWDNFPSILRERVSGLYVNAGTDSSLTESDSGSLLNALQSLMPNPHGARYDAFTFFQAFEYLKKEQPRVLFIALDETDEHAHGGRYDDYLKAANRCDRMISMLWQWIQSEPMYRDQTTMIITTDHGRGKGKNSWTTHGRLAFGSGQAWFAVIGPDTPARGEIKVPARYHLTQLASTVSTFLGIDYANVEVVGRKVDDAFIDSKILSIVKQETDK